MKIESVKATGKYVILKLIPITEEVVEKKRESGFILQEENTDGQRVNAPTGGKQRGIFVVDNIGPMVNLEENGFNVGDEVIVNDYDIQTIGDADTTYGICKAESIRAVIKVN